MLMIRAQYHCNFYTRTNFRTGNSREIGPYNFGEALQLPISWHTLHHSKADIYQW
jgi:hypothetical protein